jgi:hypothetical protein
VAASFVFPENNKLERKEYDADRNVSPKFEKLLETLRNPSGEKISFTYSPYSATVNDKGNLPMNYN